VQPLVLKVGRSLRKNASSLALPHSSFNSTTEGKENAKSSRNLDETDCEKQHSCNVTKSKGSTHTDTQRYSAQHRARFDDHVQQKSTYRNNNELSSGNEKSTYVSQTSDDEQQHSTRSRHKVREKRQHSTEYRKIQAKIQRQLKGNTLK